MRAVRAEPLLSGGVRGAGGGAGAGEAGAVEAGEGVRGWLRRLGDGARVPLQREGGAADQGGVHVRGRRVPARGVPAGGRFHGRSALRLLRLPNLRAGQPLPGDPFFPFAVSFSRWLWF